MAKKIKTRSRSKVGTSAKKKLEWEGFKITRVKLNPEQAVLSCCEQDSRALNDSVAQCILGVYVCPGPSVLISS